MSTRLNHRQAFVVFAVVVEHLSAAVFLLTFAAVSASAQHFVNALWLSALLENYPSAHVVVVCCDDDDDGDDAVDRPIGNSW